MAKNLLLSNPCPESIQELPQTGILELISPNPSSNNIGIKYKLNGANTAVLKIVKQTGDNSVNNYILNIAATETTVNISNYVNGLYTVALIINGEVVDSKTLIKQ